MKGAQLLYLMPRGHNNECTNEREWFFANQLKVVLIMFKALVSSNKYFEVLGYSFRNELMEILFNVYYPPSAIGVNSTI